MPQPTLGQTRVIDPMLTAVARGFRAQRASVADALFPIVTVAARAGRIMSFGADDFKLVNTVRAPGAGTKRVQFGYSSESFALVDHRLEGCVPVELQEEARAVPGIDLASNAISRVKNLMTLEREKLAADLARNAAKYDASNKKTLSGTGQWSHASSDPFSDIGAAKEAVRSKTGERPNVLTLGPKVLSALRSHPLVLARLNIVNDKTPATLLQLQALFEVAQIIEGEAIYHDGTSFKDVWGQDAILAYTTPASMQEMGSPNFGYTYQLAGRPMVEQAYFGDNENTWYYPYTDAYQPVLAGASAGYLFTNAAAA